jgi:hypothetical protein
VKAVMNLWIIEKVMAPKQKLSQQSFFLQFYSKLFAYQTTFAQTNPPRLKAT